MTQMAQFLTCPARSFLFGRWLRVGLGLRRAPEPTIDGAEAFPYLENRSLCRVRQGVFNESRTTSRTGEQFRDGAPSSDYFTEKTRSRKALPT